MAALTQDQKLEGVRALLNPRSIAIVGASDRPGNWSMRVFQNLRRFEFPGPIFPVNPRNKTVWDGEICYPSLADIPQPPDHVVVIVPGAAAIDTIAQAGKVKARSATVFSGGFGEGGDPQGRQMAVRLRQVIDDAGLAVSGPNCLGNMAAAYRLMTIPDDRIAQLETGPVAIVGQSGGIVMSIQRAMAARGIKTGYAICSGNEIGLYTSDYIRFLADDPQVRVITCFIESIKHAAEFKRACEHAQKAGKPVVAVKIGGTEESRKAALAHTGSLAGSLDCFDAVAETVGVIRVDTLDEAVETSEYFAHALAPKGSRLGGMTFSGGMKGMMLEAAGAARPVVPTARARDAREARRGAWRRHLARQSARCRLCRAQQRGCLFQVRRPPARRPEHRRAAGAGGVAARRAHQQQGRQSPAGRPHGRRRHYCRPQTPRSPSSR